jgi:YbbR domain-containing protein
MLRDFFLKDSGWKLFSLLLAAFIWLTVHKIIAEPQAAVVPPASKSATYGNQPVVLMAAAADTRLYGVNSNTVSVTVSGLPADMDVLQANQIHATVDLSDFDDKSKDPYRRVDVSVPWGVTVVNVTPAKVRIIPPRQ